MKHSNARYVDARMGASVFVVLTICSVFLFFWVRTRDPYESLKPVHIRLGDKGTFGLTKGNEVRMLGTKVGTVEEIEIMHNGSMKAHVSVREDFVRFVREDSRAIIRRSYGLVGDAYVEITKGDSNVRPADTIDAKLSEELTGMAMSLIDEIRRELVPMLRNASGASSEFTELGRELRDPSGNLKLLLATLTEILTDFEDSNGLARRLLTDEELARNVEDVLKKSNRSLDGINDVLENAQKTSESFPRILNTIAEEMKDLPGIVKKTHGTLDQVAAVLSGVSDATAELPALVRTIKSELDALPTLMLQTQKTLREIEKLAEGLQRHWMVRGYIDESESSGRISPALIGGD
jgi:phospholipid/cholesterol/gamma-HCH transport system substrate-binding protein